MWDARKGQTRDEPLLGHNSSISSVAFSPNGQRLVSGSYGRTVRVWDVAIGRAIEQHFDAHARPIHSVAFSPDGLRIASGSEMEIGPPAVISYRILKVWDSQGSRTFGDSFQEHHTASVHSIAFSPDGRWVVSGSADNTLRLWDVESGQPIEDPLRGHTASVLSVAFCYDGRQIVSGSSDKTLRLWDAASGQAVG